MRFRRAEVRDVLEITELGRRAFPYIKNPEEFFLRRIKEGNVIVAVDGGVIGFVDFSVDGDVLRIEGLVVKEGYRRLGIGRALLKKALSIGKLWGLRKAWLMTLRENAPARKLYESVGFRVVGEEGPVVFYERPL